jgi:hypothetical protein
VNILVHRFEWNLGILHLLAPIYYQNPGAANKNNPAKQPSSSRIRDTAGGPADVLNAAYMTYSLNDRRPNNMPYVPRQKRKEKGVSALTFACN